MNSAYARRSLAILAALGLLPGCASIISGRYADVSIASNPANAHVAVRNDVGEEVASFQTPGVAKLRRNRKFFMPARYTAQIDAPGYATAEVPIRTTANPWVLGNIVFGAVPGLVVDGVTGAVYQPNPSKIHQNLTPLGVPGEGIAPVQYEEAVGEK